MTLFPGGGNAILWTKRFYSVSRRGGRNKGGRKQMRANANKRRQTLTNADKRKQTQRRKRKQTQTNASKRGQMQTNAYTPLYCGFSHPPLQSPNLWTSGQDFHSCYRTPGPQRGFRRVSEGVCAGVPEGFVNQKNPRAHKNEISTSTPPSRKPQHPPP